MNNRSFWFDTYLIGEEYLERGGWLICDGGFVKSKQMICGFKTFSLLDEALFSCQMESTRKDVERFFGILKGRFRCLKLPILFHKKEDIDNMFFTCVILHNMILQYDGRDKLWEEDINWVGEQEGAHDNEVVVDNEDDHQQQQDAVWRMKQMQVIRLRALTRLTDYAFVGRRFNFQANIHMNNEDEEILPGFYSKRRKLVINYYHKHINGVVEWLN